jgi:hypothetical protein
MHDPKNGRNKLAACLWGTVCILSLLLPVGWAEGQWRIRINIPEYKLYLYQGIELYRDYPIAVGKRDSPSPTGSFTIVNKILHPTWYPPGGKQPPIPPGPNNPLGKYWLGLNIPGYGIHGNSSPWSIGLPVSLGCFRMNNEDIAQLFGMIPIGTPVEVVYETVIGSIDINDQAWIQVFPDIYRREKLGAELAGVFTGLPWIYQPHLKALQSLLSASQRPGKVQVPRIIKIEGDIPGIDGFYWNGAVYISRNILAVLPASVIPEAGNTLFKDYLDLQCLKNSVGLTMNWNEITNTLSLSRALFEYPP